MNASTIKDYFAKRYTYCKVILLTAIFCMATPMAVHADTQFNFAIGQEQLEGHGGFFSNFYKKSHHNEYKWKFKHCKFPIFHNYRFDKDGCSQRELNKGKVDICKQINTHNKTHVFKLCVSEKAADKLLESRWGDGDPSNDRGILSYYSPITFYQDSDGDEYGAATSVTDCLPPDGYVEDQGDCDDANAAIKPGEADGCPVIDGVDNNCDGVVDNGVENIFADNDDDGFGSASIVGCPGSPKTSLVDGDCDDTSSDINPDAVEIACDSIDNDCNSQTSDIINTGVAYPDADNDTFGSNDPSEVIPTQCNTIPNGYVTNNLDCNDGYANINPAQTEVSCNGTDDDCDADTSDNDGGITVYLDSDGDGYGSMTSQLSFCGSIPNGYVENNTDCDDSSPGVNPGAAEVCGDGIDNNCDAQTDENCSSGNVYARAWIDMNHSTDPSYNDGVDILIAKVVENNGNTVLDAGDSLTSASVPKTYTLPVQIITIPEETVTITSVQTSTNALWVNYPVPGVPVLSRPDCSFYFSSTSSQDYFAINNSGSSGAATMYRAFDSFPGTDSISTPSGLQANRCFRGSEARPLISRTGNSSNDSFVNICLNLSGGC